MSTTPTAPLLTCDNAHPIRQILKTCASQVYLSAIAEWAPAQSVTSADTSAANWIDPFYGGLMDYGKTEGW